MKEIYTKLQRYEMVDSNGKIHHQNWIAKIDELYHGENAMEK